MGFGKVQDMAIPSEVDRVRLLAIIATERAAGGRPRTGSLGRIRSDFARRRCRFLEFENLSLP
jgi:hypothetical protein